MSYPLSVKSKLFWYYQGQIDCAWYLSYATVAKQDAYIRDMDKYGVTACTPNICNEGIATPFSGEFMKSSLHEGRVNSLFNFMRRLKNAGKLVVPVLFDCPRDNNGAYPFWRYTDRIGPFIEIASKAFAPMADAMILGIETNRGPTITAHRGLSVGEVNYTMRLMKKHAYRMDGGTRYNIPVGVHEQSSRYFEDADFFGYETRNHPFQGWDVPVANMVNEVKELVVRQRGKPVWVLESNEREDAHAKAQNRAMAALPGVVGIGGPM